MHYKLQIILKLYMHQGKKLKIPFLLRGCTTCQKSTPCYRSVEFPRHSTVDFSSFLTRTQKPTRGVQGRSVCALHVSMRDLVSSRAARRKSFTQLQLREDPDVAPAARKMYAPNHPFSHTCVWMCVCAWRHREIDSPARCYFRVI